jgi:putative transposase
MDSAKRKLYRHRKWPFLASVSSWQDGIGLEEGKRGRYQTLRNALLLFGAGEAFAGLGLTPSIIGESNFYRLLHECQAMEDEAPTRGYRLLVLDLPKRENHSVDHTKFDFTKATKGSLNALFAKYPALQEMMVALVREGKVPGEVKKDPTLNGDGIYKTFVDYCADVLGIRAPNYPFVGTDSQGSYAVERWCKAERNRARVEKEARAYANKLAYLWPTLPPTRCLQQVQVDGHWIDVNWTIEAPSLRGEGVIRIKIRRLWLIALIDVVSGAILGYSISFRENYNGADVARAVRSAMVPWKPRDLSFTTVAYRVGECLPNALLPDLAYPSFDELWLDNAKAQLSDLFLTMMENSVNAVPVYGPVGSPNVRALIESFFDLLEEAGIHVMHGTTGNGPSDPRRDNDADEDLLLGYCELLDLIDLLVVRFNTSISPGTSQSRLEVLKHAFERTNTVFRHIPNSERETLLKYDVFDEAVVGREKGKAVLRWGNARYDGPGLTEHGSTVGQPVLVMASSLDPRYIEVRRIRDGLPLGILTVERRLRNEAATLAARGQMRKHSTHDNFLLHAADLPRSFRRGLEEKRQRNKKAGRELAAMTAEQRMAQERAQELAAAGLAQARPDVPAPAPAPAAPAPADGGHSPAAADELRSNVTPIRRPTVEVERDELDDILDGLGSAFR